MFAVTLHPHRLVIRDLDEATETFLSTGIIAEGDPQVVFGDRNERATTIENGVEVTVTDVGALRVNLDQPSGRQPQPTIRLLEPRAGSRLQNLFPHTLKILRVNPAVLVPYQARVIESSE